MFFSSIIIYSCSVSEYLFEETPKSDKEKLKSMIDSYRSEAMMDVDFYDLKENPEYYSNSIFEMRGYIIDERSHEFLFYADPYFDDNFGYYYVSLDNPLPKQKSINQPFRYLSVGSRVTLIAQMSGIKSYGLSQSPINVPIQNYILTLSGDKFINIPHLSGIAIFRIDNEELDQPEWVSVELLSEFGLRR
jgi:hypothetical protein